MKGKSQPKGKGAKYKTTTNWPFSPQGLTGIKQNIYDSFFQPNKGSMDTAESAAYMDRWGMMIGNSDQNPENEEELFQVRGRELPPEELIMKCRGTGVLKTLQGSKEGDWDRTIKDWHMIETGALENWGFVCTRRDQKRGAQFFSHLKDQAAKIGFRIEEPLVNVAETDRKDDINNAIANIFQNHFHNVRVSILRILS